MGHHIISINKLYLIPANFPMGQHIYTPNEPPHNFYPMSHHISIHWATASLFSIQWAITSSLSKKPPHIYPMSHHIISIQWAITSSLSNEPPHDFYPMSHHIISIQWATTSLSIQWATTSSLSNEPPHNLTLLPMGTIFTCNEPSHNHLTKNIYIYIYPPPLKYVIKSLPASPLQAGYVMLSKNTTTG